MRIGLGIGITNVRGGTGEPAIITATTAPSLGPLTDGDTVQSAYAAGSYASSANGGAATITSVVETVTINGTTGALTDTVVFGDLVNISVLVTDSEGNTQTFNAGTQTVQGVAPTAAGAIADQTFTVDEAITPLDVSTDFSGTEPITYALAPSSAALPTGLSLDSGTGVISGTPTVEATSVNIVVRGTNAYGSDDTAFGVAVEAAASFLVDAYPNGRGAWSVRALSSSITNVARVRRLSDGNERDVTETEIVDGTLVTFSQSGNVAIKTLYEQFGLGWHATNLNTANQPLIVENGVLITKNGKPSIRTDGIDDRLVAPVPSGASLPVSIFAVATYESGPDIQPLFGGRGADVNADFCLVYAPAGASSLGLFNGTVLTSSSVFTAGVTNVITASFRNPTSEGFVDGQSVASGSAGTRSSGNPDIALGGRIGNGGGFWQGEFSEVIYYDSDQAANQTGIEQNMADYFGVTL